MKHLNILFLLISLLNATSCIREDVSGNTPEANFESLWEIIDEQYCFLEYKKQEYGLDWDQVHDAYAKRITPSMGWEALFEVLSEMVAELRDGHVNLTSSLASSQYRQWFDSYPRNFSDSIQSIYLKKDYNQSSGLTYQILENNIGYIYCSSFSNGIGDGNLDQTLNRLAICDGLIIDVRNNVEATILQYCFHTRNNKTKYRGLIKHKMQALARCAWINVHRLLLFDLEMALQRV